VENPVSGAGQIPNFVPCNLWFLFLNLFVDCATTESGCISIPAVKTGYIESFSQQKILIMERRMKAQIETSTRISTSIEEGKF
jgi:hypothetical protein